MIHAVFIPLTDALLEEGEAIADGPLVPYDPDLPCLRWSVMAPDDAAPDHGHDPEQ